MRRYEAVTGERLHWGLAYRIVDMGVSLTWDPVFGWEEDEGERQDLYKLRLDDGTTIHMLYPSWSWMRWCGGTSGVSWRYQDALQDTVLRTELDFYRLMSDGHVELLAPRHAPLPAGVPDESGGRFGQSLTRLWKGPTAIDGPVVTGLGGEGLVRKVIPPAGAPSSTYALPVYDTGRLVFWTSHASIKSWVVPDYDLEEISDFSDFSGSLHVQLSGRVLSGSGIIYEDGIHCNPFAIPLKTLERLFGLPRAENDTPNNATSLLLSYIVVGQHHSKYVPNGGWSAGDEPVPGYLNALIVEWVDEEKGIAQRLGSAIFKEAEWMELDRDWRRVILQ
jgi:hypothetical protein